MRPNERKACLAIALKVKNFSKTLLFLFRARPVSLELYYSLGNGEYGKVK